MGYFAITPCNPSELRFVLADLMAKTDSDLRWLALVDTAFDYEKVALRLAGANETSIYFNGRLEALADVSPKFFELSAANGEPLRKQLGRLLRHCSGRPMLSFICCKLSASDLRERWQNLLEVETADGESYVLRFADTRVLPAVAEQEVIWSRLSADIDKWWVIGRDGKLAELPKTEAPSSDNTPIKIGHDVLSALLDAGQVDAMADYLREHFPELLSLRDGAGNYKLLSQTLALCAAHGIDATTEQYALAIATLLTEGRLLSDQAFNIWLREKAWQPGGMEDALADWMEEKGIS